MTCESAAERLRELLSPAGDGPESPPGPGENENENMEGEEGAMIKLA